VIGAVIAVLLLAIGAIVAVALASDDDDEDDATPAVATTVATDATEPDETAQATVATTSDDTATTAATTTDTETTVATTEAPTTTVGTTTTDTATTTPTNGEPGGNGTVDDPFSLGTTAPVGADWQIAVLDVNLDADDEVAANPSNSPAPAGSKYVVVRVEATYTGSSSGSPYFDLEVGVADAAGTEYADTGCTAVLEDDMVSAPSLEPGETAEGTFCTIVPTSVGDGAIAFSRLFGDDATPSVFWVAG
jgi:hypothetical protein